MSMNLMWDNGDEYPYQTKTGHTKEVMNATTVQRKLELIKKDVDRIFFDSKYNRDRIYKEIEAKLRSGHKLIMI